MRIYEVQDRNNQLLTTLLKIWENSVLATHFFLSETEVNKIKEYVPSALSAVKHLIIAENDFKETVAFMGIEDNRLEMLFILPSERKKGIGKRLLIYGIQNYNINEVTVNEQNPQAIGFYKHMGFKTYRRTDFDEQGNSYPLLYMKLL